MSRAVVVEPILLAVELNHGDGQVFNQVVSDADSSVGGTLTAVWRAEGLVDVEMAHVETGFPSPDDAEEGVRVGLVVEAEAPYLVHHLDELVDVRVVDADVLGVGHEDAGQVVADFINCRGKGLDVRNSPLIRPNRDDLEPGSHGRSRVAGMGKDRRDDRVPLLVAPVRVVFPHDRRGGVHGVVSASRLEGDTVHAGYLFHDLLELVEDLQDALAGRDILQGMHFREVVVEYELFVQPRVVLHGAGAFGNIGREVRAHGLLRQVEPVLENVFLVYLGQGGGGFSLDRGGEFPGYIPDGCHDFRFHLGRKDAPAARR